MMNVSFIFPAFSKYFPSTLPPRLSSCVRLGLTRKKEEGQEPLLPTLRVQQPIAGRKGSSLSQSVGLYPGNVVRVQHPYSLFNP